MMWLTLRQFRLSAMVALVALALVTASYGASGAHLADLYTDSGIKACLASDGDCGPLIAQFVSHYRVMQWASFALLAVPSIIGVFWGAPLVARELETGTYRLIWTQSTTRTRWLIVKLVVVGGAGMAVTGLLSLILTWWSDPIDAARGNGFSELVFSQRGIVPVAYTAFAFTFGVATGLVMRRTLPAMAATFVVFAVVWLSVALWVRPNFEAPVESTSALRPPAPLAVPSNQPRQADVRELAPTASGDWILSEYLVDPAGNKTNSVRCTFSANCADGYTRDVIYQPASRFWRFQWMETGLYAGLSVIFAAFSLWWIRYRVT